MQGKRSDLPIQRVNLLYLWDELTSEIVNKSKRLSQEERDCRRNLGNKDLNNLLKTAGFFISNSRQLLVNVDRYQNIQRLVSGLSYLKSSSEGKFINIITSLESKLMSEAFSAEFSMGDAGRSQTLDHRMSDQEIDDWMDEWSAKHLAIAPTPQLRENFKEALSQIIRRGKQRIENREIFELYLSIIENHRISRNSSYRYNIYHCQFSDLSVPIIELKAQKISQKARNKLTNLFIGTEGLLRYGYEYLREEREQDEDDDHRSYLEHCINEFVVQTSVICQAQKRSDTGNDESGLQITWSYSSSDTHYQNMFTAIHRGMGCANHLELIDFATISLGNETDSLVKSSTSFKSNDRIYPGVWVDESAILSTAQSVVISIHNWLTDNLTIPNDRESNSIHESYYDICREAAEIDKKISLASRLLGRYALHDYDKHRTNRTNESRKETSLLEGIEEQIDDSQTKLQQSSLPEVLQKWYRTHLARQKCQTLLYLARSAHLEGDIGQSSIHLQNAESVLNRPDIAKDIRLHLRLKYERKLHLFYSGDVDFIGRRRWREDLESSLTQLHHYIYDGSASENSSQRSKIHNKPSRGRFDQNTYSCAAVILARLGRLECTLATELEKDWLEKGAQCLVRASYCVAKLGNLPRTAHYLANASRAYCRLGDEAEARRLAEWANDILDHAERRSEGDHSYSDRYKIAIRSEVEISYGERLLLWENDKEGSLQKFCDCLGGAAYLGFTRLLADCLYNIFRSAKDLDQDLDIKEKFKEWLEYWRDNENQPSKTTIVGTVIAFIFELAEEDEQTTWANVAERFKVKAKEIWHGWAEAKHGLNSRPHPIEEAIASEQYLCLVDKPSKR